MTKWTPGSGGTWRWQTFYEDSQLLYTVLPKLGTGKGWWARRQVAGAKGTSIVGSALTLADCQQLCQQDAEKPL